MIAVAMVSRRLREGKTYDDFRKAWFHTVGFGTHAKLLTTINAADPREIIVIGLVETSAEAIERQLEIDINERLAHSLDDIIEPDEIKRTFGLLRADDDFSAEGSIAFEPARVSGQLIEQSVFDAQLNIVNEAIAKASKKRDQIRNQN